MSQQVRENPKIKCRNRRYLENASYSTNCSNESTSKKVKYFYRQNKTKKSFCPRPKDPLRKQIELLRSILPEKVLVQYSSEFKLKNKNIIHVTRNSIVYSAARYIQYLKISKYFFEFKMCFINFLMLLLFFIFQSIIYLMK